jgi:hypothetical protein
MSDEDMITAHVSTERLASYLDGYLTTDERDAVLAHFDECAACRREMTEARRVLARASSARGGSGRATNITRLVWTVLPATLAAAVLFGVALPRMRDRGAVNVATRGSDGPPQSDVIPRLAIVSPPDDGAFVVTSADSFVWRSASGDAEYRFTIMDATGGIVWSKSTGDTTMTLPPDLRLTRGSEYFWSVDALLADGHSTSTRVHHFSIK